mmetsp:Transcript_805/g.1851  ORF Transcript_805/g.1851 Transcript_805/m.1851 type:complete len:216 (-) Transcript_805:2378-3025(-)
MSSSLLAASYRADRAERRDRALAGVVFFFVVVVVAILLSGVLPRFFFGGVSLNTSSKSVKRRFCAGLLDAFAAELSVEEDAALVFLPFAVAVVTTATAGVNFFAFLEDEDRPGVVRAAILVADVASFVFSACKGEAGASFEALAEILRLRGLLFTFFTASTVAASTSDSDSSSLLMLGPLITDWRLVFGVRRFGTTTGDEELSSFSCATLFFLSA